MLLNGVRSSAGAERREEDDKEEPMTLSLRDSVHLVSDPRNLDASVHEVFEMMLGVDCVREREPVRAELEAVTAVVGFGGVLSGACVFRTGGPASMQMAARMTGMEFEEVDDTVKDAVGEICNMLAGSWKGRVPQLAANCGLSVPAVITGRNYKLHVQAPEFRLHHSYRFEEATFEVTIICDGLQ
jgi:chemotaxis protein CheX